MDLVRLKYIKGWIEQLPQGNITFKTINGKKYAYYQWMENGKQKGRSVKGDELRELSEKIEQRKALQEKLKIILVSLMTKKLTLQKLKFMK